MDKYEPQSLQDLAVHKRKVDDVRRWLVEAFDEKRRSKHRVSLQFIFLCSKPGHIYDAIMQRLLILTGPAGSAKTTTLRVLAREMDFDIVEYKDNTNTTRFSSFADEPSTCTSGDSFFFSVPHELNWRSRYSRCLRDLFNAYGRVHFNIHIYASEACAH